MGELLEKERLDYIKPEKERLDYIKPEKETIKDYVEGPFYDSKIVKSYEGGLLRQDTVMTTYYKVNGNRISETEYQIYMKEGMQGVHNHRKYELNQEEKSGKGNPEYILRKLD